MPSRRFCDTATCTHDASCHRPGLLLSMPCRMSSRTGRQLITCSRAKTAFAKQPVGNFFLASVLGKAQWRKRPVVKSGLPEAATKWPGLTRVPDHGKLANYCNKETVVDKPWNHHLNFAQECSICDPTACFFRDEMSGSVSVVIT